MRLIAHLSDLHFGRHDATVAEALIASVRKASPHLVVVSGDLTQRGRAAQFAAARAFLLRLPAPLLVVPGNHDIPLYDVARRFLNPLGRYKRFVGAEHDAFFADEELAVLGLNTARSMAFSNGRISHAQARAIHATFSRVPAERVKILVLHHPLAPLPDAPGLPIVGRAAMALEAAAAAGVRLVLAGHHHRASSCDLAGHHLFLGRSVLSFQAGTAISVRRRGEPNSYNLLRVERDRVDCKVQSWRAYRFETAETAEYLLAGGRWIPGAKENRPA